MKYLLLLFVALLTACSKPAKHETTLPIALGDATEDVNKKLGPPNITGKSSDDIPFATFFAHGVTVEYTKEKTVKSVSCTQLRSGTMFRGKVLGVSLGDPVETCTSLWGNPEKWEETTLDYSRAFYRFKDKRIELEIWKNDGSQPGFGDYKRGTVKGLTYAKHPNG